MVIGIDASRIAREEKTGTENYSINIIKALTSIDKKNRYVLYFNKLPRFFDISQTNVSTKILTLPRFWTQFRLAYECLVSPPDILFVPAHTIPVIRRPSLKTVVTVHDLGEEFLAAYHQFPQKIYLNWSTRYVAAHASHIISISKFTKEDLKTTLKVPSKRISVVYEGIDKELFYQRDKDLIARTRAKYGLAGKYFLYVGTIQPRKNLVRLIEGFAQANLSDTDLVLVGTKGWFYEDIYKAPEKFSVSNHVRFLGYVDNEDLPILYSGALGLTFPSLYEGFGLPILEAFACNCPVLTSNIGSMAEVADFAALLVDPLDVKDISFGLRTLAGDSKLREKMVEEGQKRAQDFSWEKAARETLRVFEKVYQQK
ncbi:MAG: glycosyltransferase family 1 protein [bacterium]|nr:glycosyltransferase family 1 protein [bacterium]